MGIIDDYNGGYENLALFTNYDTGEVDYESAYCYANVDGDVRFFPNVDSDDFADEAERDEFYKLAGEVARAMAGEPRAGGSQRTHNSRRAGSSRRGQGRGRGGGGTAAAARQGQPVPGWEATGQYTQSGKQLFSGTCSSCGELCTVPFRPIQGRSALCCYSCHHGGSNSKQQ